MITEDKQTPYLASVLSEHINLSREYLREVNRLRETNERLCSLVILGFRLQTIEGPQQVRREIQRNYWGLFDEAIMAGDIPDLIGLTEGNPGF